MKVGLLDVLGTRSLRYWRTFLDELGTELVTPELPAEDAYVLGRQSLADAPAQVQLVLGRLLELGPVDAALLPQARAVAQDAWGEALSELLPRRISGLPRLIAVPDGGEKMAEVALQLGQQLTHNPGQVRSALGQVRPLLTPAREHMPPLSAPSKPTVAVIGPDHLLRDPFLSAPLRRQLEALGLHPVYASDLPRQQLGERAQRAPQLFGKPLALGEADLFAAQSLLEGKGAVRGLIYAAAVRDAATLAALTRLLGRAHKPAVLLEIDPEVATLPELTAFAAQLGAGAALPTAPQETR